MAALATRIDNQDIAGWADRITACWRQSLDGIFATGRLLAEAKAALPHGEFRAMCSDRLPFKPRMVQMLMAIAQDQRLSNAQYVAHLPPSWGTLYDLTRLDDAALEARIADGTINPAMERKAILTAVKKQVRTTRELTLGARQRALPERRYGLILVDVPRHFNVRSDETGMDRAPENHYPTMTFQQLVDLPVPTLAADDSILVYWSTAASLIDDIEIMAEWGFVTLRPREGGKLRRDVLASDQWQVRDDVAGGQQPYRSMQVWDKIKLGMGYWFRDRHEFILVGARGNVVPPAQGDQDESIVADKKGRHSAKPVHVHEMIERLWPTTPKVELFARTARPGWDVWGLEAPTQAEASPTDAAGAPIPHDEQTGEVVE